MRLLPILNSCWNGRKEKRWTTVDVSSGFRVSTAITALGELDGIKVACIPGCSWFYDETPHSPLLCTLKILVPGSWVCDVSALFARHTPGLSASLPVKHTISTPFSIISHRTTHPSQRSHSTLSCTLSLSLRTHTLYSKSNRHTLSHRDSTSTTSTNLPTPFDVDFPRLTLGHYFARPTFPLDIS